MNYGYPYGAADALNKASQDASNLLASSGGGKQGKRGQKAASVLTAGFKAISDIFGKKDEEFSPSDESAPAQGAYEEPAPSSPWASYILPGVVVVGGVGALVYFMSRK